MLPVNTIAHKAAPARAGFCISSLRFGHTRPDTWNQQSPIFRYRGISGPLCFPRGARQGYEPFIVNGVQKGGKPLLNWRQSRLAKNRPILIFKCILYKPASPPCPAKAKRAPRWGPSLFWLTMSRSLPARSRLPSRRQTARRPLPPGPAPPWPFCSPGPP